MRSRHGALRSAAFRRGGGLPSSGPHARPAGCSPQAGPPPTRAHTPEMGTSLLSGVPMFPPSDRQRVMTERADNSSSCPENRKVSARKATVRETPRQEREPRAAAPPPTPSVREAGTEAGATREAPKGHTRAAGTPHFVLLQRETLGLGKQMFESHL